jgi:hypothetical protein
MMSEANAVKPIEVPDYLKTAVANSTDADSLAASSISIPRVSLRGRKFRLVVDSEELKKPADELDAVILAVEPGPGLFIKTFYEGQYSSGDSDAPSCASSDGIVPDGWVTSPQSNKCSSCPKNQFGSATSRAGKKSKACRDSKRIWLALPEDVGGTVFAMGVPVTSLKAVAEYAKALKTNGYPLPAVITKMAMEDTEFPQLIFSMGGFLPEASGLKAIERNVARDWGISKASQAPMLENSPGNKPTMLPSVEDAVKAMPKTPASDATVNRVAGSW